MYINGILLGVLRTLSAELALVVLTAAVCLFRENHHNTRKPG